MALTKNLPDRRFFVAYLVAYLVVFLLALLASGGARYVQAKRSEAARRQEEQRQLQELDEAVARLHGNSQCAR